VSRGPAIQVVYVTGKGRCIQCRKCGEWKPMGDFYTHMGARHNRRSTCKPCFVAYVQDWKRRQAVAS
jgi:hypothetical protein